jgi:hypothetical protein
LSSIATLAEKPVNIALKLYVLESEKVITQARSIGAAEAVASHSASRMAELAELGSYIISRVIVPESIVPPKKVRYTLATLVVSIVATEILGAEMDTMSPIACELYEKVVPFPVMAIGLFPLFLLVPNYKI